MSKYIDGINEEAMDAWLKALRSGDYQQAKGMLRSMDGRFCCLGVATEINADVCNLTVVEGIDRYRYVASSEQDFGSLMPVVVMDYLGIPSEYREATLNDGSILVHADMENAVEASGSNLYKAVNGMPMIDVVHLNDSGHNDFNEIADRIEMTFKVEA